MKQYLIWFLLSLLCVAQPEILLAQQDGSGNDTLRSQQDSTSADTLFLTDEMIRVTQEGIEIVKALPLDSIAGDSMLPPPEVETALQTVTVNPGLFFKGRIFREEIKIDYKHNHFLDEIEHLPGFTQSLGQTGKPYRQYLYGFLSEFFPSTAFVNPLTGHEDVYIVNPEKEIRYYDTRTPYVDINYDQGAKRLIILEGSISQNITPFINSSVVYKHRLSNASYINSTTDQYNIYWNFHGHTYNDRYQIFLAGLYSELIDNINGGTGSNQEFDFSFDKGLEPVVLQDAIYRKRYRALVLDQYVRLAGSNESAGRLTLSGKFKMDEYRQQYGDAVFNQSFNGSAYIIPVYPTIDTTTVLERMGVRQYQGTSGLNWRYDKNGWEWNMHTQISYLQKAYMYSFRNTIDHLDNRTTQEAGLSVLHKGESHSWSIDGMAQNTTSSLYSATQYLESGIRLNFGKNVLDHFVNVDADTTNPLWYKFSTHRPFHFNFRLLHNANNPSYFYTYYQPAKGNSYQPDPNLNNQILQHIRGGFEYEGRRKLRKAHVYDPVGFGVEFFYSSLDNLIYFDSTMGINQAASGSPMERIGATLRFSLNWKWFTLENETTIQRTLDPGDQNLAILYQKNIPWLHGRASLFYESWKLPFAAAMRVGVDFVYQSGYRAHLFDPVSQEFYGKGILFTFPAYGSFDQVPPYGRLDAVAGFKIKRVYIYFRVLNVTEGFPIKGYYTTPYYPMLERSFQVGVNWNFFD